MVLRKHKGLLAVSVLAMGCGGLGVASVPQGEPSCRERPDAVGVVRGPTVPYGDGRVPVQDWLVRYLGIWSAPARALVDSVGERSVHEPFGRRSFEETRLHACLGQPQDPAVCVELGPLGGPQQQDRKLSFEVFG